MTVLVETAKVVYLGDGATTVFVYPFRILEDDDLLVTVESVGVQTLVLNTDYTVTGTGDVAGTLILTTASRAPDGSTMTIQRNMDAVQNVDFVEGEAFSAVSVETSLDRAFMVIQQQKALIDALSDRISALPVLVVAGSGGALIPSGINTSLGNVAVELPTGGLVCVVNTGNAGYSMVVSPSVVGQTIMRQDSVSFEGYDEPVILALVGTDWVKLN